MSERAVRSAFLAQAGFCEAMDAPITGRIAAALAEALDDTTLTGGRVLGWAGNAIEDALPLRLIGGLRALALRGDAPDLAALFEGAGEAVAVLTAALRDHDDALLPWLDGPPQTNEPGRSAALMLGLMLAARRFGHPIDVLEIGSSAGLNLLIGRYAYDLGGSRIGPADSPVTLAPDWRGTSPDPVEIQVASARGVDVAPLDLTHPADADRLRAYVWADHPDRYARLDAAIAMFAADPPLLERGDAAEWVEARLAEPQPAVRTRVLMHSVVWQYLGPDRQQRIAAALDAAGARATKDRPLAWVRLEPDRDLARHQVHATLWPGGETHHLAASHPHGRWISPAQAGIAP
ncbi:hypothetical protein COC42_10570 [Sphingomonas spermidinifaciens]|uniref:DUF2332 domain-containing protein n=1 Tax=Sphingomonas spermidinifaciens TaxID=1141889 RepID=A0A2A4B2C9_9SPHN|nr:DUF2332 domain-containing protein [Sphingomonas spermidinifaciens]PCD01939.1 hypothetical protein COC42_10570 [Sphingomonas spermidinifaciens]